MLKTRSPDGVVASAASRLNSSGARARKGLVEAHRVARTIVGVHDRARQQHGTDRKQPVLKARDDSEIAAAAADRPE